MGKNNQILPVIQPWTKAFWEGTQQGKLLIQSCTECGSTIFFPKKYCPDCWSSQLEWIESSGRATVYTFSIMKDMVVPAFMGELPYVLAMVDIQEGIRMTTRIANCRPEDVSIGMEVQVLFQEISPEFSLPFFQPVDKAMRISSLTQEESGDRTPSESSSKQHEYKTICCDIGDSKDPVCTITLNRPEKCNAINRRMAKELIYAFQEIREVPSISVVVLTGGGCVLYRWRSGDIPLPCRA